MPPDLDTATAAPLHSATAHPASPAPAHPHATPAVAVGSAAAELLRPLDNFARRHLGSGPREITAMLDLVGFPSLDALIDAAVPADIRLHRPLAIPAGLSESEALGELRFISARNQVFRSYLGMGYADTLTPGVIQRNILEKPGLVHRLHALPGRDCPGPHGGRCSISRRWSAT